MTKKKFKSYGLGNPLIDVFPEPIISDRPPTTADSKFHLGQVWVDDAANNIYGLAGLSSGSAVWNIMAAGTGDLETLTGDSGGVINPVSGNINIVGNDLYTVAGSGNTLTITETSKAYPISDYVVGAVGSGGYITIQSAIDAANAAGGGIVYIKEGTYTENLVLYDKIQLVGASGNVKELGVVITGTHTPPATSSSEASFANIKFTSSVDIFANAASVSLVDMAFYNCSFSAGNGYILNVPNYTKEFYFDNCIDGGSTHNGIFNGAAGAVLNIKNSDLGKGSLSSFVSNAAVVITNSYIGCPMALSSGTSVFTHSTFFKTITLTSNAKIDANNCFFYTATLATLVNNSSSTSQIQESVIWSSNANIMSGTGSTILGGCTFTRSSSISSTVSRSHIAAKEYSNALITTSAAFRVISDSPSSADYTYGLDLYNTDATYPYGSADIRLWNEATIFSDANGMNFKLLAGDDYGFQLGDDIGVSKLSVKNQTAVEQAYINSVGSVVGNELTSTGDVGGLASATSITNVTNTSLSTGTLSIKSTNANNGDNEGFIKVYIGTTVKWIPYFGSISP